jgi:hypothetical protein
MKYFLIEIYESSGRDPSHEVWHKQVLASRSLTGAAKRGLTAARRWWSDPYKTKAADSDFTLITLDGKTDRWPCAVWESYDTFSHALHSLKEITRADYLVLKRHL